MTDDTPTLDGLAEDLEDIKANLAAFASQLETTTNKVDAVASAVASGGGQDGQGKDGDGKKEKTKTPPFILWLTGEKYAAELAALDGWVTNLLVPTYLGEVSSSATWCACWWEHPPAVARLHALWLSWQELTDPETCGRTGPSVWHRDHLDPAMAQLRAPDGPFAACMTSPDRLQHDVLPVPPVAPLPTRVPVAGAGAVTA
ncbi:DUF4913 domain-containing protein [Streptomyces sp. NBC_00249]|uniref:DUF4913 domain-containing protein n=1 Tax=Streptomyces sp. NBC_00249 TaxID=2975690 RepID=UPI0022538C45|nr:DUF4913 domain-containing protein [Streptomyces sp. NBC_00249]MCX5199692.1 DUF4913 domain-containing protein [Streptomyces sp. NBC_00249]